MIYPSGMRLPRGNHNNAEDFPAAGEPDPVNLIETGIPGPTRGGWCRGGEAHALSCVGFKPHDQPVLDAHGALIRMRYTPTVHPSHHLTSLDNPRVKVVVRLRGQRERRQRGRFIAEGVREVSRALEAGLAMEALYGCPERLGDQHESILAGLCRLAKTNSRSTPAAVFTVTTALMAKMAYRQNPEGVLAVFQTPSWDLQTLVEARVASQTDEPDLWLVAVGTQKPGNLGAMVRSAAAAGCHGVLVVDGVVDALNPNAIRASTGAVFRLPTVGTTRDAAASFLTDRGVLVVAATPQASLPYTQADFTGPVALVIGPEHEGLGPAWLKAAGPGATMARSGFPTQFELGCQVRIPMHGHGVDSLNASAAAAVLMFEAVRQRCPQA